MSKKLKADFHSHTWEDPYDIIKHDAYEYIEFAADKGYEVLAITNHGHSIYCKDIEKFAQKHNVLLIPGVELSLREGHVILLFEEPGFDYRNLRSFSELKNVRSEKTVVIAPHPFFPTRSAIGSIIEKHPEYIDAVEYSMLYFKYANFNKKAKRFAEKNDIAIIGVSDAHSLWQLDYTYTLVDSDKSVHGVINAIRNKNIELVTRHMPFTPRNIWGAIEFMLS